MNPSIKHLPPRDETAEMFPTPPWMTRALLRLVLDSGDITEKTVIREPACGKGHMSDVLAETGATVFASDKYAWNRVPQDIADYAFGEVNAQSVDWTITHPPQVSACAFIERAILESRQGCAFLMPLIFADGSRRYERLFKHLPPNSIHQFSDPIAITKDSWKPDIRTGHSVYAWFVWRRERGLVSGKKHVTTFHWIPPCRDYLTDKDDVLRFAWR